MNIINFYMDDSGTRRPDRKPGRMAAHGYDFFGLGGILIRESDESEARRLHHEFCQRWDITYPLHSVEIRHRSENFAWIGQLTDKDQSFFYGSLHALAISMPVVGLACVIDRPGYNKRYEERYGHQRWRLCKTAFCIAVERATKYAIDNGSRLRVLPERSSKKDDNRLRQYYDEMRSRGAPFDPDTSSRYRPVDAPDLQRTLYEFKTKNKSSPMAQIADLYLWPMGMGGYHRSNRSYRVLREHKKLVDDQIGSDSADERGIKYSCFEGINPKP